MEEIVLRVLQGTASPEEVEQLARWRAADPANEAYYRDLARLRSVTRPGGPSAARRGPPSSFEIIRIARDRGRVAPDAGGSAPPAWQRWAGRMAAAVILVALGFGVSALDSPQALFAGGVVTTSASEMATVTLGDGTVVRIGPSSRVRIPEQSEHREIWLEGEAFFSIAAMEDQPFTVHTRTGTATALETRFRVQTRGEVMRVGVLEGRVAVAAGASSRELVGGEVGQVAAGGLTVHRAASQEELRPRMGNFLAFRTTPLWTVVEEVEAHYGISTEIQDQELGGRTVTATFQDASFAEVMSVICRITAAHCSITDSVAVIGGNGVR